MDSMAISKQSSLIYIGTQATPGSTLSCYDMNGTYVWSKAFSNYLIYDIALSPDESFLAAVDNTGKSLYQITLSNQSMTWLTISLFTSTYRVSISPNSSMILVSGNPSFGLYSK